MKLVKTILHIAALSAFAGTSLAAPAPFEPSGKGGTRRGAAPAKPGQNVPAIKVNLAGYPSAWPKLAVFNVSPGGGALHKADGSVAWPLPDSAVRSLGKDAASKDPVWQVDFSSVKTPGKYFFHASGQSSDLFEISAQPYTQAVKAAVKHFYYQRCRTDLKEPHTKWEADDPDYRRPEACHDHDEVGWLLEDKPQKKTRVKMVKGWHDAGNYDMYVPSTAPTSMALMMAWMRAPSAFPDGQLNIPESGNKIPDILDEALWGLEWVLSMQRKDGAVYSRDAVIRVGESHGAPANKDKSVRWVSGIGDASTAKACAAFALASRVYGSYDPKKAARFAQAAKKAWAFLQAHPERILVKQHGSNQPLWDDGPEYNGKGARFLAAVEMMLNFGDAGARAKVKEGMAYAETQAHGFTQGAWGNLSRWALSRLAMDRGVEQPLRVEAAKRLFAVAQRLRETASKDGYRCASKDDEYYWGHNSNLLEKADMAFTVWRLYPNQTWARDLALDQWHWVFGRNPNGVSMVTRIGGGPRVVYHGEFQDKVPPPPGLLIGGPNHKNSSYLSPQAPAKALLWDNALPLQSGAPAHALWHNEQSDLWEGGFERKDQWGTGWWNVLEGDIYYNANLVLMASNVMSMR